MEEIRRVVADPLVTTRLVAKTEEQKRAAVENLTIEREITLRMLADVEVNARPDRHKLTNQMERRLEEIDQELRGLKRRSLVDDLREAIIHFGPLWNSLNSGGRSRIVIALIERIVYNSTADVLTIESRHS